GMEDYSDPGYAYLAELLASRGMIAVSVDQNYINGSWSGDFRGKEMAARAWLLLEHLDLWRDWNADPAHPFAGRVDLDRVALVGHSRGGEAVAIAYAFNDLPHFPDNATVRFDYGFGIRSLVAIAQVDQRYARRVHLDDVNFLTLHGSYDADEPAYHGLRQFNRIHLSGEPFRFKAGVYIHGANHGQFNSTWGRADYSPPEAWLLNTAPLIPGEEQRQIATVYIAAFMDATLRQDRRYLPMFRDPRLAAAWLPDHPYVHQYRDSTFEPIATFEEDLDVTTGTLGGATIEATGFELWREEELKHRDERLQGTSAVVLGWRDAAAPVYTVRVPAGFFSGRSAAHLTLSISGSTEKPPGDGDEQDAGQADDPPTAPQFTLAGRLTDGRSCSVNSADLIDLAPPFRVRYLKHEGENEARYNDPWEPVLQHVEIPLTDLACEDEPVNIEAIDVRFAAAPEGVVILDDIGLRYPPDHNRETP
ncbi:MAG: hypothetical protein R3315_11170, partial [Woeseiaceae bacterium]|nr:hypothetical protein [Woeseiaceae bacterium]